MAQAPTKPLITANQVTLARLLSMPLVVWAFYQGETGMWIALIVGIGIGLTDTLDGWLARKHGPTVLGGLMDPIADKVFVAVLYVPFADIGWLPAWVVALVFVRELLVTGLRTAYNRVGVTLRTSYLAKAKTWTQMQAAGTLFLVLLIHDTRVMWGLIAGGAGLAIAGAAGWWLVKKRLWRGSVIMFGSLGVLAALYAQGIDATLWGVAIVVLLVTWASGLDYFIDGVRQLRGKGKLERAELVRIASALALPPLVLAVAHYTDAHMIPLAGVLALELAVGGLDNLLAAHRATLGAAAWSLRTMTAAALLAAALGFESSGQLALMHAAVYAAAAVCAIGAAREFWRGRDYYMDARIRDKKAAPASA